MLVESVSVKNFKLLGDFSVGGLRPVTLLGGDNGCGKTTLLEAVFMCLNTNWEGGNIPILSPLRSGNFLSENGYAHLFHRGNFDAPITAECIGDGISSTITVEPVREGEPGKSTVQFSDVQKTNGGAPLETQIAKQVLVVQSENNKVQSRVFVTLEAQKVEVKREITRTTTDRLVQIVRDSLLVTGLAGDADNLSQIAIKGEKHTILKALQIVFPQATDAIVASIRGKSVVFVRVGNTDPMVPSEMLGAGAQKVLSLALALYSHSNALFLLDEITIGWHHSRLINLWRMIFRVCKERNHQIIATTHSREGIGAFAQAAKDEVCQDDACYIRLDEAEWETDPSRKIKPSLPYSGEKLRIAVHEMETEVR